MGLDYSIVLLLPAQAEPSLHARLRQAGALEQTPYGLCATLDFPLDDVLFAYLAEAIADRWGQRPARQAPGLSQAYPDYFPTDDTGRVGYWHVTTLRGAAETGYVRMTAATSRMSRLLQHSTAVRQWLQALCGQMHATAAFLDLEDDGVEFICRVGHPISATLDDKGQVLQAAPVDRSFVAALSEEYLRLIDE